MELRHLTFQQLVLVAGITTLLLILTIPSSSQASFWSKCRYAAKIDAITFKQEHGATVVSSVTMHLLKGALVGGHLKHKQCGLTSPKKVTYPQIRTDKEKKRDKMLKRTWSQNFFSKNLRIKSLKAGDIIAVEKTMFNSQKGDTITWEVIQRQKNNSKKNTTAIEKNK